MKKLNINEFIKVKLTDLGTDIYYHQYDELNKFYGREMLKPHYPEFDKDGFTKFQLHKFMNLFGKYMVNGFDLVIENNNIYICEEDLREVENEL